MKLVVTGGAGFIGSAFVRLAVTEGWAERVINLDKLTYAGNLENLATVAAESWLTGLSKPISAKRRRSAA